MKIITAILLLFSSLSFGQYIPADISTSLNLFLEELEMEHLVTNINQSSFPKSQKTVYLILQEAELNGRYQNARQKAELGFYLRQFKSYNESNRRQEHDIDIWRNRNSFSLSANPPGLFIRNNKAGLSITPQIGATASSSSIEKSANAHWGARICGNTGPVGYYLGYKRNYVGPLLYENYFRKYILPQQTFYYTKNTFKGGISFDVDVFSFAVLYDKIPILPVTKHSELSSEPSPSYPLIMTSTAPLPWLSYEFMTGILSNGLNNEDLNSYINAEHDFTYFARNQLTINPLKRIELTIGQAAFIKKENPKYAYLLPLNLYTSTNNTENTFLYYQLQVATLKHVQLSFAQTFDDFSSERMGSDYDKNVYSYTMSAKLTNWPIQNSTLQLSHSQFTPLFMNHEYTPLMTQWPNITADNADNKRVTSVELSFKPLYNLMIQIYYQLEQVGESYTYDRDFIYEFETLEQIMRKTDLMGFEFTVHPAYNMALFAGIHYIHHRGESPSYRVLNYDKSINFILRAGINIGL